MPIYDYVCRNCSHTFEEILSYADRLSPESETCKKCGSKNTINIRLSINKPIDPYRLGLKQPTTLFKERLAHIKKIHKNGEL